MSTRSDYLFRTEAPWITIGPGELDRKSWIPSRYYVRSGMDVCVRQLVGRRMRTTQSLMNEFAAALQFFPDFGANWYALADCLQYLDERLPCDAYVLVVESSDDVLRDETDEEIGTLLNVLHEVGQWWAKPISDNGRFNRGPISFHVLFHLSDSTELKSTRLARIANAQNIPVRLEG